MMHHLPATATVWEVAWTVPACVALLVRLYLLWLVVGDAHFQRRQQNNEPERRWAGQQIWHKGILVVILLCMAVFGLTAMLTPPTNPHPASPTRVTYVLTTIFVLIPLVMLIDATQTLVVRRRVNQANKERRARMTKKDMA
jgi:quinol-cytochrome oxidoreductase complex cytochrome b subunit